jgi:hypothetical protein
LSQEKPKSDVEGLVTLFKLCLEELQAMRMLLIEKGITTGFELNQMTKHVDADLSDMEVPAILFFPFLDELEAVRRLLIEKGIITADELNQMFKRLAAEQPLCGGTLEVEELEGGRS